MDSIQELLASHGPQAAAVLPICLFIWAGYRLSRYGRRESYLPSGPPTKPLIGNISEWPKASPHLRFTDWAATYGGIYSLKLAHQTVVVLSSLEAIRFVLGKNSAASSDRPPNHIKDCIEGQNNNLILARYSDEWRSLRRAAQQILSPHACRNHLPIQEAESLQLMYDILRDPESIRGHLRRYSTSVIMSVMFGVRFPRSTTSLYLEFWEMVELAIHSTAPTSHPPMDIFPILRYVPERWAPWKTMCKSLKASQTSVFKKMLKPVQDRLARGEGNGAFMEEVYMRQKEWNIGEDALLPFGYIMMVAGADTTSSFLQYLVMFLSAYPEVLKKAQEEMDKVVGDRIPELDDIENLPYLRAVINETHRLRPVTPVAVPHAASEDIRYQDYIIPKGSIIFQNTWGLFRDPDVFPDPDTFRPDRFIERPELNEYPEYVFGSGRRACVGIHLAHTSIQINTMNIIWAFDISKARDEQGKPIEPNLTESNEGLVQGPKELRVSIKPRSPDHERTLRQTYKASGEAFRSFEYDLTEDDKAYVQKLREEA